jgi:hypothetical protein
MKMKEKLCSGFGQDHTDNPKYPMSVQKKYTSITLDEIFAMVERPQQCDKKDARWFIPSTLHTREGLDQKKYEQYYAVWCDFDNHTELDAIIAVVEGLPARRGLIDYLIYSTASAKEDCQKWRCIIPLATPVTAQNYRLIAQCVNDVFEAAGIIPDRASERANQLCYLPNRGEFYRCEYNKMLVSTGLRWNEVFENEISQKLELENIEKERVKVNQEQSRIKAMQRPSI